MAPTIETFINSFQNRLEPPVRQHLKNVYATLMMTCVSASVGVFVDMYTSFQAGFLSTILGIGLMLMLIATPDNGKNTKLRLGYLLGFGLTSGIGLGPLLEFVSFVDPSIIVTALLGTSLVFVCFSIASMLAERGSWLFLGGTLMTLLTSMSFMSLANIFMQSHFLYQTHLYLGLVLMCGFVLFDTQLIIEKRRMGSKDFVQHALELFIDFIGIFRRLVIILTQKEEQDRRRKRD
ncbi:PREDICTED: probable Bax inhibitor 1 [Papilio xuthus]|uniref:Bax inhibitor n=1 Tax=Papilio xuthus TaxID=66420 RepID=I4DJJ3_PAPXU|nr:probable Bax inhibitor 1 [Papilio xuthus]KPI91523.1 putative Bax inhibitor 1 [Papilio xuthus]BAM18083.1 bax inhibitor [Papilio xuthus]